VTSPIYAGGTVCWKEINGRIFVLLIHRNRHNDVSLPKGKVDPGETLPQTASRETFEETGLRVALGIPLGVTEYLLPTGRLKVVHYWAAEVTTTTTNVSHTVPNEEVARLEWVPLPEAKAALTYKHDGNILDNFASLLDRHITRTFAIIALRHGKAVSSGNWTDGDQKRPLTSQGKQQAIALAPIIASWHPRKLISSTAERCTQTITPLSQATGLTVKFTKDISQHAYENNEANVRGVILKRIHKRKTVVLCSHSPVLGEIMHEVAQATASLRESLPAEVPLKTGSFWVIHLSATNPATGIISIETHSSSACD
jgi:8-oxo-dGTP pyrophosphatase MutT (NUDIX family)/phosphohistidine phosphatase SixA